MTQARLWLRDELKLAPLFEPQLRAIGIIRAQLIDTPTAVHGPFAPCCHTKLAVTQGRRPDPGALHVYTCLGIKR